MQEYKIIISPQEAGRRLDLFLLGFSKEKNLGLSRTHIQRLLKKGEVSLKNITYLKSHYKIKAGDQIILQLKYRRADTLKAEDIPLDILYEDEDVAVINKPSGLVVHPAPGNYAHTLVNALLYHFGPKNLSNINPERPGIVHRLDKETSGILVIAKNNPSHLNLTEQFSRHSIKRRYIAIVKGRVEFDENIIELPIARHPLKRGSMSVGFGKDQKYAKTYYRTLKRRDDFSLLELEPFTGRTHQLRVHLAYLGHPILGDIKYGKKDEFKRLALHAKYIGFHHPRTAKFVEFSCEMPPEFKEFLDKNKS